MYRRVSSYYVQNDSNRLSNPLFKLKKDAKSLINFRDKVKTLFLVNKWIKKFLDDDEDDDDDDRILLNIGNLSDLYVEIVSMILKGIYAKII